MSDAWPQRLFDLGRDIKLSHSLFALPFAILGGFLAAQGFMGWARLGLLAACMFFARTFAMLANRYVDRALDGQNPRTASRALPSGRLRPGEVLAALTGCGTALALCAAGFGFGWDNWWPMALSPAVLAWLGLYGFTKRFTVLCHFVLGGALAISPLAAALAIQPQSLAQPGLWWLAAFVLLWVAGFDVIYAMQDQAHDRAMGLRSIPARLGARGALWAARVTHLGALASILLAWRVSEPLEELFLSGIVLVGLLLVAEHISAARGKFQMAFFTLNGLISLILGGLGIADVLIHGM